MSPAEQDAQDSCKGQTVCQLDNRGNALYDSIHKVQNTVAFLIMRQLQ